MSFVFREKMCFNIWFVWWVSCRQNSDNSRQKFLLVKFDDYCNEFFFIFLFFAVREAKKTSNFYIDNKSANWNWIIKLLTTPTTPCFISLIYATTRRKKRVLYFSKKRGSYINDRIRKFETNLSAGLKKKKIEIKFRSINLLKSDQLISWSNQSNRKQNKTKYFRIFFWNHKQKQNKFDRFLFDFVSVAIGNDRDGDESSTATKCRNGKMI